MLDACGRRSQEVCFERMLAHVEAIFIDDLDRVSPHLRTGPRGTKATLAVPLPHADASSLERDALASSHGEVPSSVVAKPRQSARWRRALCWRHRRDRRTKPRCTWTRASWAVPGYSVDLHCPLAPPPSPPGCCDHTLLGRRCATRERRPRMGKLGLVCSQDEHAEARASAR